MKQRALGALAALAPLAFACGGTDGTETPERGGSVEAPAARGASIEAEAASIRDSAGVAIVANPAEGSWGAAGAPRLVQELRIGDFSGPPQTQFGAIAGLDVGSDGSIYVLDLLARRIKVFDANGAFLREMGGEGSGPGELSAATTGIILAPGDTIIVPDVGQFRLTRFAPDGRPAGSTPIDITAGLPLRWDRLPDGRVVQQARWMPAPGVMSSDQMPNDLLLAHGPDGVFDDTLLALPAGQSFQLSGGGEMRMRLLEAEPVWAILDDGRIAMGLSSEYRISIFSPEGELQRIITKPFTPRPVTEADRRAILNLFRQYAANSGAPPQMIEQMIGMISFAENFPAFGVILGGPDGTLWVQRMRSAQEMAAPGASFDPQNFGSPTWDVFDREGRLLGPVTMPERFQPVRLVDDRIYGVWRDELDVQYVLRLRLDAPPTAGGRE